MPSFGKTSEERLQGVDEHLVAVAREVVKHFDCTVLGYGGVRTPEEQADLVAKGASKTLQSKHLTGEALDLAPYPVDWGNHQTEAERQKAIGRFYLFAGYFLATAQMMGIRVRWGGNWHMDLDPRHNGDFDDLVHFELVRG